MTREERKTELEIVANHISATLDDLSDYVDRLEELRDKRNAKKLDTIVQKLYCLQWDIHDRIKGR